MVKCIQTTYIETLLISNETNFNPFRCSAQTHIRRNNNNYVYTMQSNNKLVTLDIVQQEWDESVIFRFFLLEFLYDGKFATM